MRKWNGLAAASAIIVFSIFTPLVAEAAVIRQQDFDLASGDPTYWSYTNSNGNVSAAAGGANDVPGNSRAISGKSYRFNYDSTAPSVTAATLTLNPISVVGYTNVQIVIPLSAVSKSAGDGLDVADYVSVDVQTSATASPVAFNSEDILLKGRSNARWAFTATGSLQTTVGTRVTAGNTSNGDTYSTPSGANLGTGEWNSNGIAKLLINVPDSANYVSTRIILVNDGNNELWAMDNIQITGTAVTPEPACVGVLAAGGGLLLARRRRRR